MANGKERDHRGLTLCHHLKPNDKYYRRPSCVLYDVLRDGTVETITSLLSSDGEE